MIIAPPLDPTAEETKAQGGSAEKQCILKFRNFEISEKFHISRSYVTLSPEYGVIVRLDLEQAEDEAGVAARFMCWTDKGSGDFVSAWAMGHKGPKLPE